VTPDEAATADGIKMRSIDSFTWTRALPLPGVSQAAIIARDTVALNQLTIMDDCRGLWICSFESILIARFFTSLGVVTGSGVASMQYGSNVNRRLRALQDDEAVSSEFEMDFSIKRTDNNVQGTSGASSMGVMALTILALTGVAAFF
jgi:hypothetical protein